MARQSLRREIRTLQVQHLIEQAYMDTLRRFARALWPYPLPYQEADLCLRQCHAERDLEDLGKAIGSKSE